MTATFGARLRARLAERGPLCVGIDPHPRLLTQWGLGDDVAGLARFVDTVVDALAGEVAVLKPQSALFERHGSKGIAVLEEALGRGRAGGAVLLLDAKRGDVGSTMQGYADAYLDPSSSLFADAVTASPYLGFDALQPLFDTADRHGCGVFVLGLTSNPEGVTVQRARTNHGDTVAGSVLRAAAQRNGMARPLGSTGVVVGATIGATEEDFGINGPLLAPGLGAQGGTPEDLRVVFGDAAANVVPATSREVLSAGPDRDALRTAALRAKDAYASALEAAVASAYDA